MKTGKNESYAIEDMNESDEKIRFIQLKNSVGQSWLFPANELRSSLSLFRPSTRKGKLFKAILPFLCENSLLLKLAKVKICEVRLHPSIERIIFQSFGVSRFDFAIFEGSPGVHKKATLKVFCDDCVYGYCKIATTEEVMSIFKREAHILSVLKSCGVAGVPEVLYCGRSENGAYLFIQSTMMPNTTVMVDYNSRIVKDYVEQMNKKTAISCTLDDSDFNCDVCKGLNMMHHLPKEDQMLLADTVEMLRSRLVVSRMLFCAYHGDFTPWNSFVSSDGLFVFDWEYAKKSYPPLLDYFHYFTQSCIYDKRWSSSEIWSEYFKVKKRVLSDVSSCDLLYLCYLVSIILFYLNRDRGILNDIIGGCMSIWIDLIKKINKSLC